MMSMLKLADAPVRLVIPFLASCFRADAGSEVPLKILEGFGAMFDIPAFAHHRRMAGA